MRVKTVLLLTTCAFCCVNPVTSSIILTGKAAVAVDTAGAIATLGAEMLAAKSAALLAAKKAAVSLAAEGIATIAAKGAALKGAALNVVREASVRAAADLAAKRRLIAVASHLGAKVLENTAEIAVELPVLPQPALVIENEAPAFIEVGVEPLQVFSPLRKLIHDSLQHKAKLIGDLVDAVHGVSVHQYHPAPVHEYQVEKARLHRVPVFANIEIGK